MIFFDNASTSRVREECLNILTHFYINEYYNPSSLYSPSVKVSTKLKQAREGIIKALNGSGNLVFTSGGTESDNLALLGLSLPKYSNIVLSSVEHSAIYNTGNHLKQLGYDVRFCKSDSVGCVDVASLIELIDDKTSLVSIMHVCNETGAINDIKLLCRKIKAINKNIIFHSDGVQALGKIKIDLDDINVDLYSLSAHKINAPKGTGALFIRQGINLTGILFGGAQEKGLRPSTENVAGIFAFEKAIKLALAEIKQHNETFRQIREKIMRELPKIDDKIIILSNENCADNILTFASNSVRGEVLLHALSDREILVGTGSACSSKNKTHRIPEALGLQKDYHDGLLRLSFGIYNTLEEADIFVKELSIAYDYLKRFKRS